MGKKDNRRTRKMNQKRSQKKKLARENAWMKVVKSDSPKVAKAKSVPATQKK